jgi:hypothetical protein
VGFDTLTYWLDIPADMAHENIEVNLKDANGRTALISAVDVDIVPMFGDIERHTKAIQLLLTEDGIDVKGRGAPARQCQRSVWENRIILRIRVWIYRYSISEAFDRMWRY